ncbi:glycosyltransferase family 2 protein [Parabacteroides bouchesdurhonensis]|uniref:glycosyltransferase family 2 protein n=1 Tax=Parabacteroides bouchesdurhonensis TaxID=1936995 RepID=UPI000C828A67|nr:glycosyltransferase family A protein [Parabacteroides bouchesdurhonensis]
MTRINCFIPYGNMEAARHTVSQLSRSPLVDKIYLLAKNIPSETIPSCSVIQTDELWSTETMRKIAGYSTADYSLIYTKDTILRFDFFALERFIAIAEDSRAGMVYSDYYELSKGERIQHPVIEYQQGSLRDDFNFGSLLFYKSPALIDAVSGMAENYHFAGLYDLRLKVSQQYQLVHIDEYLYTEEEYDLRKSGEKIFDYVDPKNRTVQLEMEAACTDHLKMIGAYLPFHFKEVHLCEQRFETEASVIIPVRNRTRTIEDAIRSVLMQETTFPFNLIVIDNHSTDGTTEKIQHFTNDKRLIHLVPERDDLGIGGCWNMGVHHPACGKFAVQLDSDDVYSDENTLQKIVNAFYEQQCAMVVGTYMMTDFNMEMIPPGIISHKEWTPENGRNNALRINGLGAPRAFYTPLLRNINFPNTSYGEDYAVGLRISREYRIGRIYDVLYLCRRWEDNSDAALDINKMNKYNTYKDKIRTWELQARLQLLEP